MPVVLHATEYQTTEYVRKVITVKHPDKQIVQDYDNGRHVSPCMYELEQFLVEYADGMMWFHDKELMQAVSYWIDRGIDEATLTACYRYYDPVNQCEPEILAKWSQYKQQWERL